jgi:hypothetical protein
MGGLVVDLDARTIRGLGVPYDQVARSGSRLFRFLPGWARHGARVPLLRDHDFSQRLGWATEFTETPAGLVVLLRVFTGPAGDRALAEAARLGLSPRIPVLTADLRRDPGNPGVRLVVSADLLELSLTARPAFEMR